MKLEVGCGRAEPHPFRPKLRGSDPLSALTPEHAERYRLLRSFLSAPGGLKLDAGCGEIEPILVGNDPTLVGMDRSLVALKRLREAGFRGHLVLGDVRSLPFKSGSFKRAVSSEVIEHLPSLEDAKRMLRELDRVSLRSLITAPNREKLFRALYHPLCHDHKLFFSEKSILRLLRGLRLNCKVWTTHPFPCMVDDSVPILSELKLFRWLNRIVCRVKIISKLIQAVKRSTIGRIGAFIAVEVWR